MVLRIGGTLTPLGDFPAIPPATETSGGEMTAADKTKLNALDVRSITDLSLSGRTLTIAYVDGDGAAQTVSQQLPAGSSGSLPDALQHLMQIISFDRAATSTLWRLASNAPGFRLVDAYRFLHNPLTANTAVPNEITQGTNATAAAPAAQLELDPPRFNAVNLSQFLTLAQSNGARPIVFALRFRPDTDLPSATPTDFVEIKANGSNVYNGVLGLSDENGVAVASATLDSYVSLGPDDRYRLVLNNTHFLVCQIEPLTSSTARMTLAVYDESLSSLLDSRTIDLAWGSGQADFTSIRFTGGAFASIWDLQGWQYENVTTDMLTLAEVVDWAEHRRDAPLSGYVLAPNTDSIESIEFHDDLYAPEIYQRNSDDTSARIYPVPDPGSGAAGQLVGTNGTSYRLVDAPVEVLSGRSFPSQAQVGQLFVKTAVNDEGGEGLYRAIPATVTGSEVTITPANNPANAAEDGYQQWETDNFGAISGAGADYVGGFYSLGVGADNLKLTLKDNVTSATTIYARLRYSDDDSAIGDVTFETASPASYTTPGGVPVDSYEADSSAAVDTALAQTARSIDVAFYTDSAFTTPLPFPGTNWQLVASVSPASRFDALLRQNLDGLQFRLAYGSDINTALPPNNETAPTLAQLLDSETAPTESSLYMLRHGARAAAANPGRLRFYTAGYTIEDLTAAYIKDHIGSWHDGDEDALQRFGVGTFSAGSAIFYVSIYDSQYPHQDVAYATFQVGTNAATARLTSYLAQQDGGATTYQFTLPTGYVDADWSANGGRNLVTITFYTAASGGTEAAINGPNEAVAANVWDAVGGGGGTGTVETLVDWTRTAAATTDTLTSNTFTETHAATDFSRALTADDDDKLLIIEYKFSIGTAVDTSGPWGHLAVLASDWRTAAAVPNGSNQSAGDEAWTAPNFVTDRTNSTWYRAIVAKGPNSRVSILCASANPLTLQSLRVRLVGGGGGDGASGQSQLQQYAGTPPIQIPILFPTSIAGGTISDRSVEIRHLTVHARNRLDERFSLAVSSEVGTVEALLAGDDTSVEVAENDAPNASASVAAVSGQSLPIKVSDNDIYNGELALRWPEGRNSMLDVTGLSPLPTMPNRRLFALTIRPLSIRDQVLLSFAGTTDVYDLRIAANGRIGWYKNGSLLVANAAVITAGATSKVTADIRHEHATNEFQLRVSVNGNNFLNIPSRETDASVLAGASVRFGNRMVSSPTSALGYRGDMADIAIIHSASNALYPAAWSNPVSRARTAPYTAAVYNFAETIADKYQYQPYLVSAGPVTVPLAERSGFAVFLLNPSITVADFAAVHLEISDDGTAYANVRVPASQIPVRAIGNQIDAAGAAFIRTIGGLVSAGAENAGNVNVNEYGISFRGSGGVATHVAVWSERLAAATGPSVRNLMLERSER